MYVLFCDKYYTLVQYEGGVVSDVPDSQLVLYLVANLPPHLLLVRLQLQTWKKKTHSMKTLPDVHSVDINITAICYKNWSLFPHLCGEQPRHLLLLACLWTN